MSPTDRDAVRQMETHLRREEAVYQSEAAIGAEGIEAAITTALADVQAAIRHYEATNSEASAQHLQGLTTGLGRLLALRDGLPAEHKVSAFYRGRDYRDVMCGSQS